MVVVQTAH